MTSFGRLSVIVMLPSPTFILPAQLILAPAPTDGPSNVLLAAGSNFAQGDQASHLCRSFTCANTMAGGADIVAMRVTLNSDGRVDTRMTKPITRIASVISILIS